MVKIPKTLWTHINTALPNDVCLVATVLQSGYAQITLRGSTLVFDDGHFSLWGTGQGLDDGKSRRRHKGHDLLPQLEPLEELERTRRSVGNTTFDTQWQQDPTTSGADFLRAEHFQTYDPALTKEHTPYIIQAWDTALAAGPMNDYSVCMTAGYPQRPAPGNNRDAFGKRDGGSSAPRRSCCTDGGSAKATYDGPGDWIARRCSHQSTAAGTDSSARERPVDGPVPTSRRCDCQCGNDGKVCGSQHAYLQVSGHLLNGPLNQR